MDRIVFLAIGSMGDVLPLAKVAKQLSPASTCVFITHLEHNVSHSVYLPPVFAEIMHYGPHSRNASQCVRWDGHRLCSTKREVGSQAWLSAVLAGSGASQEFVTTSPAQVWNAPLALALSAGNAEEVSEDDSLEEYLKACMSALGIPGVFPMRSFPLLLLLECYHT